MSDITDEIVRQMEISGAIVDYTEYLNRELPIHKWKHHSPLTDGDYKVRFKWAGPRPTDYPMLVMWVEYNPSTDLYNIKYEVWHDEQGKQIKEDTDIYVDQMIDPTVMLYDIVKSGPAFKGAVSEIKDIKVGEKTYTTQRLYPNKEAAEADIRALQDSGKNWRGGYVAGGYMIKIVEPVPDRSPNWREIVSQTKERMESDTIRCSTCGYDFGIPSDDPYADPTCPECEKRSEGQDEYSDEGYAENRALENDEIPPPEAWHYYFTVWNDIDEIPASPDTFRTYEEAVKWRNQFIKRFEAQGYYSASSSHWRSMISGGRIPIDMIKGNPSAFFPIKAHKQETFLSHDGLDAQGNTEWGKVFAAFYKWGKFEEYDIIDAKDLRMVHLNTDEEEPLKGITIHPDHEGWQFYAEEKDIDVGDDGISVKRAWAVPPYTCLTCGQDRRTYKLTDEADPRYCDTCEEATARIMVQQQQEPKPMRDMFAPQDGAFPITFVSKDDLFERLPQWEEQIRKLTDQEMEYIARKMADDYIEQLFWTQIDIIVGDYLADKEAERK